MSYFATSPIIPGWIGTSGTPLFELAYSTVHLSRAITLEREVHLQQLRAASESELEREWLAFNQRHLLPPARYGSETDSRPASTCCDFYYRDKGVVIYVDGPPHDQPTTAC